MSDMASTELRPAEVCRRLLAALEASDGRRGRRKRDTPPDAIGIAIKRSLLEAAAREDPSPEGFEAWLLRQCQRAGAGSGPVRAMALDVLHEWRLAQAVPPFEAWLERGAPSDDAQSLE